MQRRRTAFKRGDHDKTGSGQPVIVVDRVSLAFDEKVVLKEVSFTLLRGHTKMILGASGSGKSTILKLILWSVEAGRRHIW